MKKRILYIAFLLLLISSICLPVVLAQTPAPTDPISLLTGALRKVFSFDWATSAQDFLIMMRLFVWFFLFIVYFSVLRMLGQRNSNFDWMARRQGIILGAIIASISVMFMPTQILIGAGIQYGELGAIILFAPIFGACIWLILTSPNHCVRAFLLLVLIYLLWWIAYQFNGVEAYYNDIASGARFVFMPMLPLLLKRLMKRWQTQ